MSAPNGAREKPAKWLWGTMTPRDLNPAYVAWLEARVADTDPWERLVELWHEQDFPLRQPSLQEWLGLTDTEYEAFVRDGRAPGGGGNP